MIRVSRFGVISGSYNGVDNTQGGSSDRTELSGCASCSNGRDVLA